MVMFPFIILGKLIARKTPLDKEYDIFFFLPDYAIGGAEKVNAEIIKCFPDKKVIVFFTKKSPNNGTKHLFDALPIKIVEIHNWTDNKFKYWNNLIYRGIISSYINCQKNKPIVFIGQCNFGYKITPHINSSVRIIELIHVFDNKLTWVWAPFVKFISKRIVVGNVFLEKYKSCYIQYGIPKKYLERFTIIRYCIDYMPDSLLEKDFSLPLKVYYAGRGGAQKRLWLLFEIMQECKKNKLPVTFKLAGPFRDELPESFTDSNIYIGELSAGEGMHHFHKTNDILLMTSAFEGFPLVIMEAMCFGAIPLVPNIDAIPENIIDGENGFLINDVTDEKLFVQNAINKLKEIAKSNRLNSISNSAFQYAQNNYSFEKFKSSYRKVFLEN